MRLQGFYHPQTGEIRQAGTKKHGVWAKSPEETRAAAGLPGETAGGQLQTSLSHNSSRTSPGGPPAGNTLLRLGTRVRPLVGEDPMCRGATKPVCLGLVLCNKRGHRGERPSTAVRSSPRSLNLEKARKKQETRSNHQQTNSRRSRQEGRHHTPVGLTTRN